MSSAGGRGPTGMSEFVDLAAAAERVARLLPGVSDDQLTAPSPCAGTPVGGLIGHLAALTEAFRAGAAKEPDSGPPPAEPPGPPADWRTRLPSRLDALVVAWREPGALDGEASVGGVTMPAAALGVVALDELLLHGWDLAVATGQGYRPEPAEVDACLGFVAPMSGPDGVPGLFGPAVPVPADAPAFDRLLGLSGRDPAWSAPPVQVV